MAVRSRERSAATAWRRVASGLGAAACALLVGGCALFPSVGTGAVQPAPLPPPPAPQLNTVPVEYGSVQKTVQVAGVITPCRSALLYFHNGGTIKVLRMQVGQDVRAGEIVAAFDTSNDLYQIAQQRLTMTADTVALQALEAQDAATPAASAADALQRTIALQEARLQLLQDRLQLAEDELTLRQDEIVAPWSGQITKLNNQVGDYVNADQVVAELDDVHCGRLVANLNATQAQEVAPGDPALVSLTGGTGQSVLNTTVASVQVPTAAQIQVAQQNPQLGALKNPQVTLALPPGFRVTPDDIGVAFQAQITVASANGVLYVPNNVISSFNGLDYVNVLSAGTVSERPVRLGLQGDQDTVVLSGLREGEQVVPP